MQSIAYFMIYPKDPMSIKLTVTAIWVLDTAHTCLVMASMWNYLIQHFGDETYIDFIPWTIAASIAVTALTTFLVHCFLAQRIYILLQYSWKIAGPIMILAATRLVAAVVTTAEMARDMQFSTFTAHFLWLFTLGLALSSVVDLMITMILCYYLCNNRKGTVSMVSVVDSLILYTFETGALTCFATIISMVFWVAMPSNRVFLSLHFVISKLYANSLLSTLNMRVQLRRGRDSILEEPGEHSLVIFPRSSTSRRRGPRGGFRDIGSAYSMPKNSDVPNMVVSMPHMEIGVHRSIEKDEDYGLHAVALSV